jgi:SAM-dependent methyltransferase
VNKDAFIDATGYYQQNADDLGKHGPINPLSTVVQTGKLPASPSQTDWALFWMLGCRAKRSVCLDIGCAHLYLLRPALPLFERCVGVDITSHPAWLDFPEIQTHIVDVDRGPLPFIDQSFDVITMLMTLEHVFNPFHAVREIWRVAKPDAQVIIGVPNIAGIRHRLGLLFGRFPVTSARYSFEEDAWDGYHLHNFTQASLAWLLRREGFEPIRWASHGRLQILKRLSPALFGDDLMVLCRKVEPQRNAPPIF